MKKLYFLFIAVNFLLLMPCNVKAECTDEVLNSYKSSIDQIVFTTEQLGNSKTFEVWVSNIPFGIAVERGRTVFDNGFLGYGTSNDNYVARVYVADGGVCAGKTIKEVKIDIPKVIEYDDDGNVIGETKPEPPVIVDKPSTDTTKPVENDTTKPNETTKPNDTTKPNETETNKPIVNQPPKVDPPKVDVPDDSSTGQTNNKPVEKPTQNETNKEEDTNNDNENSNVDDDMNLEDETTTNEEVIDETLQNNELNNEDNKEIMNNDNDEANKYVIVFTIVSLLILLLIFLIRKGKIAS